MSVRKGWAVYRVTPPDDRDERILEVVKIMIGLRAEARARQLAKQKSGEGLYVHRPVTVEESDRKPRAVYAVRRLPMDTSFDDLEIVATTCVMGTLTSIKVQTPHGILYRTPLTSDLRSELNRLSVVRGTRISATSRGKNTIHTFEVKTARSQ